MIVRSGRCRVPKDGGVGEDEGRDDHAVVPERAHRARRRAAVGGEGREERERLVLVFSPHQTLPFMCFSPMILIALLPFSSLRRLSLLILVFIVNTLRLFDLCGFWSHIYTFLR